MNINKIIEDMKNNQGRITGVLNLNNKVIEIDKPIIAFDSNGQKHITFILNDNEV